MKHPDRMVFDLDPGEGITWPQIVQATELVKAMLDEIGLKSFLKTSGGKGLHIVVPLAPQYGWDVVKGFSRAIVEHLAQTLPTLFVAKSGPKNRIKRIFVDYLRNGFGATTACAFSARARAGLGVSVPVAWSSLPDLAGSAQWTIRDYDDIVSLSKAKPWKAMKSLQQTLTKPAARLDYSL
jgi:bifunctional non-homologous end joining protein LigD